MGEQRRDNFFGLLFDSFVFFVSGMKVTDGSMSHHSEDGMLIASSDSFWEPGNFKRQVEYATTCFLFNESLKVTLIKMRKCKKK